VNNSQDNSDTENETDSSLTEQLLQKTETRLYIEANFISQHRENDLIRLITTVLSYMSDEYLVGRFYEETGIALGGREQQLHVPSDIIVEVLP